MSSDENKRTPPFPHPPPEKIELDKDSEEEAIREYSQTQQMNLLPLHSCINHSTSLSKTSLSGKSESGKVKILEQRLSGATAAIRHLEKQSKDKDELIASLQQELQEQVKALEAYQSQYNCSQTHLKSSALHSSVNTLIKKKEKQLQEVVKKQQERIDSDAKTALRLQEINKNLLQRVKEQESRGKLSAGFERSKEALSLRVLHEENERATGLSRKLQQQNEKLLVEAREWEVKYSELLSSSIEFEEKTRELYRVNQLLNANLFKLLETV